jgi:drug/metabolite transporter (DMT)-like permease
MTGAERRDHLDRAAMGLLVVLCASWGLNQVAVKVANDGISPVFQAALRSIGSGTLLFFWARARGLALFGRDGTWWPGLACGALFALEFVLFYWGLVYTTASRGVVFMYTAPFVVALGAHLFVPGDRLTRVKLTGLAAAFSGLAIAFADSLRLPSGRELIGDLMCFGAAIFWGSTTVLIKASSLARASGEKTLFYQLAVSAVILLPLALGEAGIFAATPLVLGALAYQTIIVAFASYAAWFWLLTYYPASRMAAFTFLTPVLGVVFGHVLLGEPIGPLLLAALALIAAGIYLVNRPG